MIYLTHYTEYPIFEAAEGGYYYAGQQADDYYRLNSMKQAKRQLKRMQKSLEKEGFNILISNHYCEAYRSDRYVGNGEMWIVEKVYGSNNRGWRPYE